MKAILERNAIAGIMANSNADVVQKKPVFGVFERDGRVYTEIVLDCKRDFTSSDTGKGID